MRFSYPGTDPDAPPVLDGLNLMVESGETVALVGRTGCGKTTVARLLCRFYDVDAGAVLVDGNDVRDLTLASLRHHANQVTDEPFLFSESIRDNIAFGRPDAPLDAVVRASTAAQAHGFVGELADGYDEVVGERGYTLSGGQRQRICIARALALEPNCWSRTSRSRRSTFRSRRKCCVCSTMFGGAIIWACCSSPTICASPPRSAIRWR